MFIFDICNTLIKINENNFTKKWQQLTRNKKQSGSSAI